MALLPLRLFLGVTFIYAGVQKLSDPGFLRPGAPTYIGAQLHAFANGTPGGFLLRAFALPAPKLAGVAVALVEIGVGLLALTGLATRVAASVGLLLNLVLFLTNSWKTYPYFLGSDIVFVFAWLPFVLAGAAGQPALDSAFGRVAAARPARTPVAGPARRGDPRRASLPDTALTRRGVLAQALGGVGVATLALGGIAALAKGNYRSGARLLGSGPKGASATTNAATRRPAPRRARHSASSTPPGAVKLGYSRQLPAGQAAIYRDPGDRRPDILIREGDGSLRAFSAICTHQGCTVGYQGGQIICPCHGGVYNARTGAVEGGPPPAPLPGRRVLERDGVIYAFPA